MQALRALAEKAAGREVDWINIANARALTELGLAARTRDGWTITAAGERALAQTSRGGGGSNGPIAFPVAVPALNPPRPE